MRDISLEKRDAARTGEEAQATLIVKAAAVEYAVCAPDSTLPGLSKYYRPFILVGTPTWRCAYALTTLYTP